jgi:catechol 2,3-dioxygenase-like lactoylglutathione lyase family enzyme
MYAAINCRNSPCNNNCHGPQRNLDFYCEVLGLRFVKRAVNFDNPGSYHFYFGDDIGSRGSILTFFAWPQASRGHAGTGETSAVAFYVPASPLHFWEQRILAAGSPVEHADKRFGNPVLSLGDPDGMRIELVGSDNPLPAVMPRTSDIPAEHAIRGFDGVTLSESSFESTAQLLEKTGFARTGQESNRIRFLSPATAPVTASILSFSRSSSTDTWVLEPCITSHSERPGREHHVVSVLLSCTHRAERAWLSSAIARVGSLIESCVVAGIQRSSVVTCGFSQGACLATEFVARHLAHYGALIVFTGGLVGPSDLELQHDGSLAGMRALFSSGDPDPHVPWSRVEASVRKLERMGLGSNSCATMEDRTQSWIKSWRLPVP